MKPVSIRNVRLTYDSRRCISRFTDCALGGNLADVIESSYWYVHADTHEYSDLRDILVREIYETYDIPGSALVEIRSFDSDILSFEKGVYPER